MAQDRRQLLMQEALDENLTPEAQKLLGQYLEKDAEAAQQYNRLKQVDQLFRSAPFERAPARLALSIMARIAEQVKMQPQDNLAALALSLSLSTVILVMMPALLAASWLVVNAMADPELLIHIVEQAVALLVMMIEAMKLLLDEVQQLIHENPEMAAAVAALIPLTLLGFVRYLEDHLTDGGNGS